MEALPQPEINVQCFFILSSKLIDRCRLLLLLDPRVAWLPAFDHPLTSPASLQ